MDACSGGENEPDETNEADSEYINDTDEDEATTKTCVEQSSQTTDDLKERKLKKEIESVNKRWEDHIQFVTKAKNDKIASIEQELDEQTEATERLQRTLNEEKKKFEEKLRNHTAEMKKQTTLHDNLKKENEKNERNHIAEMKKQMNLYDTLKKKTEESERNHTAEMKKQTTLYDILKRKTEESERNHSAAMKKQTTLFNTLKRKTEETERKLQKTEQKLSCCEKEYKDLQDHAHTLDVFCTQKSELWGRQENELHQLRDENKYSKVKVASLKEHIRTREKHIRTREAKDEAIISILEAECTKLGAEKKDLLMRLTKMAGEKLTQANPAIADLSDVFRPTKLAEMFSEVYDNEWTDAFEEQSDRDDEEDAMLFILNILHKAYDLCKCITKQHQEDLMRAASTLKIGFPGKTMIETKGDSPSPRVTDMDKDQNEDTPFDTAEASASSKTTELGTDDVIVDSQHEGTPVDMKKNKVKEVTKELDDEELKALKDIQKTTAFILSKDVETVISLDFCST